MTQKISPKIITLAFSVLVLCFLVTLYVFAFTDAPTTPPGCPAGYSGCDAPINVGPSKQWKLGTATQNPAIGVFAGTSAPYALPDGAIAANIFRDSDNVNYYVNPDGTTSAILAGNVGIGTTSPTKRLDVRVSSIPAPYTQTVYGAVFRGPTYGVEIGQYYLDPGNGDSFAAIRGLANTNLHINPWGGRVGIGTSDINDQPLRLDRPFKVVGTRTGHYHTAIFIDSNQRAGVAIGGFNGAPPVGSIQSARYEVGASDPVFDVPLLINEGGGNVGIGVSDPQTRLAVAGLIGTNDTINTRVLRYFTDGTGRIYYYSSSERYKSDIQPFQDDFSKILQIEPKSFIDNVTGQRNIGYIAEDLDEIGLKYLVGYKDGKPDTIEYNGIVLYLLEVVKDQQRQINELRESLGK